MKKKVFVISLFIFALDQMIKVLINNYLTTEFIIVNNFFSLYKVYNSGAAFSIFTSQVGFLIVINIVLFIILFKYVNKFKVNLRNIIAFGLIFGGLFGNLLDRILNGYVIDYLKFSFGNYTFPIFNLADTALCIGVFLIIIAVFLKEDEYENCSK